MIKSMQVLGLALGFGGALAAGPIHLAAERGETDRVIAFLMIDSSLLHSTNERGLTPRQLAQAERHESLERLLNRLEAGERGEGTHTLAKLRAILGATPQRLTPVTAAPEERKEAADTTSSTSTSTSTATAPTATPVAPEQKDAGAPPVPVVSTGSYLWTLLQWLGFVD